MNTLTQTGTRSTRRLLWLGAVFLALIAVALSAQPAKAHVDMLDGGAISIAFEDNTGSGASAEVPLMELAGARSSVEAFDGALASYAVEADPAGAASAAYVPFDGWGMLASVEDQPGSDPAASWVAANSGSLGRAFEAPADGLPCLLQRSHFGHRRRP